MGECRVVERVEAIVVGAGIVGLAVARALAQSGRDVIILEAADAIGTGISSRNSEVIHAGINYPKGGLKGRLCVAGRDRLYAYCAERGIAAPRLGKLIVANAPDEIDALRHVIRQAADNGVRDLVYLDRAAARRLEPALECRAAVLSPSTGIIDSHALMISLLGDAEAAGAAIAFNSPVDHGAVTATGIRIAVGGAEPCELECRVLINAAGLGAVRLARNLAGLPRHAVPGAHLCKGSYYGLTGRAPFQRLIYPAVTPGSTWLGVHLTLDLAGQARFGPDAEWIDTVDYAVDPARADGFYAAIRRYWPDLPDGALRPAYAGIRPKIVGPTEKAVDFRIDGPAEHGIDGLVNLLGIESPGLTASLAIGDAVLDRLGLRPAR
jgi:L-2-hydroxyglutarate oxidase LhgO